MPPAQCPAPTSAAGRPVTPQHPASQVTQSTEAPVCIFHFESKSEHLILKSLSQSLSGCWCPEGFVMSHTQQCGLPEECVCEVAGVRYWPGQKMKMDCEVCVCERGRPQRCQPNPDCSGESVKYTESPGGFCSHLPLCLSNHTHSLCSALWLVIVV